jgi:6-phosphofructokinase 1
MVLEVMGRDAGWIALHAGIGGGADIILIPEIPFNMEAVAAKVMAREFQGSKFSIIVVAEGAKLSGGNAMYVEPETGRLGGIGISVANNVAQLTGKDARVVVLGHLQRGGEPTAYDRVLATRFGAAAVREVAAGNFGQIVVLKGAEITTIGMDEAAGKVKVVPSDGELVAAARGLGIAFGDETVDEIEEASESLVEVEQEPVTPTTGGDEPTVH